MPPRSPFAASGSRSCTNSLGSTECPRLCLPREARRLECILLSVCTTYSLKPLTFGCVVYLLTNQAGNPAALMIFGNGRGFCGGSSQPQRPCEALIVGLSGDAHGSSISHDRHAWGCAILQKYTALLLCTCLWL